MTLQQFHDAIYSALDGRSFDLMVMFSCLTGIVEVGYSLMHGQALRSGPAHGHR
jgi:hypothetical protein